MPLTSRDQVRLATVDPVLARLVVYVSKYWPCMVICGHRDQAEQHAAFLSGRSKLDWPHGKHNAYPSQAVDLAPLAPLPLDWNDTESFIAFSDFVTGAARRARIGLRWGGDWDGEPATPNRFNDLVHFELIQ